MAKDLFSLHAKNYGKFRPTYPLDLYWFIYKHTKSYEVVWDCATGNGQAAVELAKQFSKVYATDISENQLANAPDITNIHYSISSAEETTFADHSFDLITIAQAAHWLNLELFYQEVKRVIKPNGTLAIWGYGLVNINSSIDEHIHHFYKQVIGSYWDSERKLIDDHYRTLLFPFEEIQSPDFQFSFDWTIDELYGYLTTWSSVQKFIRANNHNPVEDLVQMLRPLWISGKMKITFPLFLRLGKVR
jgi:SAM-dependent methyltransferase